MAPKHPEWKNKQPFKAVLENNMQELMKQDMPGLMQVIAASHTGTNEKFDATVKAWINSAQHPAKKKLYKDLLFQPMLELIRYLQANDLRYLLFLAVVSILCVRGEKVFTEFQKKIL